MPGSADALQGVLSRGGSASGGGGGGGAGGSAGAAAAIMRRGTPGTPENDEKKKRDEDRKRDPRVDMARQLGKLRGIAEDRRRPKAERDKAYALYRNAVGAYGPEVGLDNLKKFGVPEDDFNEFTAYRQDDLDPNWAEKGWGVITNALDLVSRPQQRLLQSVQALNAAKDNVVGRFVYGEPSENFEGGEATNPLTPWFSTNVADDGAGNKEGGWGLPGAINPFSKAGLKATPINFRQAMLQDKDAGGLAGDVGDFAGMMATDPLNFVSFGSGPVAKGAIRQLVRAGEVGIAEKLAMQTGRRAIGQGILTEAEQATARRVWLEAAEEAGSGAARSVPKTRLGRAIRAVNPELWADPSVARGGGLSTRLAERGKAFVSGREALTGPELYAKRAAEQTMRRGGGGLVLGGRTVPGTGGKAFSRMLNKAGLPGWNSTRRILSPQTANGIFRIQTLANAFTEGNFGQPLRSVRQEAEGLGRADEAVGRAAGEAYAAGVHAPDDPATQAAFKVFNDVTQGQAEMLHGAGIRFEVVDGDPYKSVDDMIQDVAKTGRIKVRSTAKDLADMEPGHVMAEPLDPAVAKRLGLPEGVRKNDLFRAVHDLFGHAAIGNDFGRNGEEVAYAMHAQMYPPEALPALAAETRGENSYLNFFGDNASKAPGDPTKVFPKQKMMLMPTEFTRPAEDLYETVEGARNAGQGAPAAARRGGSPAGARPAGPAADAPPLGHTWAYRGDRDPSTPAGAHFHTDPQYAANFAGPDGVVRRVAVPTGVLNEGVEEAIAGGHVGAILPTEYADMAVPYEGAPGARVWDLDDEVPPAAEGIDPRGPVRATREDTLAAGEQRIGERYDKQVGKVQAAAERAEAKAADMEQEVLDLQDDLQAVLDSTPGTPTYGMGEKIGKARQKATEADAGATRAEQVARDAAQEYRELEQRAHAAEGGRQEQAADLQDAVTPKGKGGEGRRPGFGEGRRIGRTEQEAKDLARARDRAKTRAIIAREAAEKAREAAGTAQERLDSLYDRLDAAASPGAATARSGEAVAPRRTYGMGKRVQRAEQRARDAAREAREARWRAVQAERKWNEAELPKLRARAVADSEEAGRRAFLGAQERVIDPDTLESRLGSTAMRYEGEKGLFGIDKRIGVKERLGKTKVGKTVRGAFIPREGLHALPGLMGDEAAERAHDVVAGAGAQFHQQVNAVLDRFYRVIKKGKINDNELDAIYQALETPGGIAALKAAGATDEVVAGAQSIRDGIRRMTQRGIDAGVMTPDQLRDVETYMHRLLTDAGREALYGEGAGSTQELVGRFMRERGLTSKMGQGGALKKRTLMPDAPMAEAEEKLGGVLRKRGALKEDEKLFDPNPFRSAAIRIAEGEGAVAEANVLQGLSTVMDDQGRPLVMTWRRSDNAASQAALKRTAEAQGYKPVELSVEGNVVAYAHPEVLPEVQRLRAVVFNDEAMGNVGKFMDYMQGMWKRWATVPVTSGTGFVARNVQGNIISNYIRGVSNLVLYKEGAGLQRIMARAALRARNEGETWDQALEAVLANDKSAMNLVSRAVDKVAPLALTDRRKALVDLLREHGIVDEGFYMVDLSEGQLQRLATSRRQQIIRAANPLGRDSVLTKPLQELNNVMEQNARIAHFIDKLDKLGSPIDAARSVRETLFDYSDLTPFERQWMKRIHAFYTFTRKNLPLYARAIKENPGRVRRPIIAQQTFLGGGEQGGDPRREGQTALPEWAVDGGQVVLGDSLARLATGNSSTPAMGGLDLPIFNALETIQPLVQEGAIAAGQVPILRDYVNPRLRPRGGNFLERQSEVARSVLGMSSGSPAEVARFAYEMATKTDSFTGAPLTKQDGSLAIDRVDLLLTATEMLAPGIAKSIGIVDTVGGTSIGKGTDQDRGYSGIRKAIARALIGVQLTPIDEKGDVGAMWGRYFDMEARLKAEFGDRIPTQEELVEAGFMDDPSPPRRRSTTPTTRRPIPTGAGSGGSGSAGALQSVLGR